MPVLILQKDDTEKISESYPLGEHVLGRGNKLACSSKKVSRKHAILKFTDEGIFLKSTHNNPCFYQVQDTQEISVVTFGNSIKVNQNDKIALSLDHGWFIVQIKTDSQPNDSLNNDSLDNDETILTLKRELEESCDESPAKKSKPNDEINTNNDEINTSTNEKVQIKIEPADNNAPSTSSNIINSEPIDETITEIKTEPIDNIEPSTSSNTNINLESEISSVDVKLEFDEADTAKADQKGSETRKDECRKEQDECKKESDECKKEKDDKDCKNDDDKPSTSGTNKKPWRDRCWYGSSCYRKNGAHRVELSHPGDSDFESDPEDSRPICCYGANCYRKNKEHRKRYRHPGQTKLGTKPAPLPPKRRVKPKPQPLSQDSEELDDYDYDDPFLYDGSEDEYEPSQETDTESEFEDSQEAAEDHRRLLKEARKFTRKQK